MLIILLSKFLFEDVNGISPLMSMGILLIKPRNISRIGLIGRIKVFVHSLQNKPLSMLFVGLEDILVLLFFLIFPKCLYQGGASGTVRVYFLFRDANQVIR